RKVREAAVGLEDAWRYQRCPSLVILLPSEVILPRPQHGHLRRLVCSDESRESSREASQESPENLGIDTWDLMLARAFRTR
ncbi:MAG: hypothetical protein ACKO9H_14545, partial [Planctomycetota bacterium]